MKTPLVSIFVSCLLSEACLITIGRTSYRNGVPYLPQSPPNKCDWFVVAFVRPGNWEVIYSVGWWMEVTWSIGGDRKSHHGHHAAPGFWPSQSAVTT